MASSLNLASILASKIHQKRVTVIRPVSAPYWSISVKVKSNSSLELHPDVPGVCTMASNRCPKAQIKCQSLTIVAWLKPGLNNSPKESDRDSAGFGTLSPLYLALGLNLGLAYRLQ
jgi:hypothetical protein